ncbi:hypothetical protein ACFL1S_03555 [Pseudomonadota bacterium]
MFFGKLSRHLAKYQPFYVFQGKNLDKENAELLFDSVFDLADEYCEAIIYKNLAQPLVICGRWGPVVLETGRALRARGIDVAALIVFDNGTGGAYLLRKSVKRGRAGGPSSRLLRRLLKKIPGFKNAASMLLRKKPSPAVSHQPQSLFHAIDGTILGKRYRPVKYDGAIYLFRSEEFAAIAEKEMHCVSWLAINEKTQIDIFPGTHRSMWDPPHVSTLGQKVQAILDQIMKNPDALKPPQ